MDDAFPGKNGAMIDDRLESLHLQRFFRIMGNRPEMMKRGDFSVDLRENK